MQALALVEAPDHVCSRYRVRAFEGALRESGCGLVVESIASSPLARLRQIARARSFETVLLQRKLLPRWQIRALRQRARRLVFDLDDAILYRDSYDPRGPHDPRRLSRFRLTVQLADQVIVGNAFLADCAREAGAHPDRIQIIPTCLDTRRLRPIPRPDDRPGLELVWIGSSSTLTGLERQKALWERVGREVPGVRLRLVCDRFLRFDALPVIDSPWSESTEADDLASADVGISWLPDDLWSRGKCGLKVLQYQAAGLPVLANPVGVHPDMIEPGVSGFLAHDPDAWVEALRILSDDADLRRRIGRAARASVEAGYSVENHAAKFVGALTGTRPKNHLPHESPPQPMGMAIPSRSRSTASP